MNITQGVPRIKEIINGAKNISTPVITAKPECKNDVRSARVVKGRIEKSVLGEVAKSIKMEMTSRQASIVVTLDMERIQTLHPSITAESVKRSILQYLKKLKDQHIRTSDGRKIIIFPPETDRNKLHFDLHSLKAMLAKVIVKGISTVERAVIRETKGEFDLLVEGKNLQAVMCAPGVVGRDTTSNHIAKVEETLGIEAARIKIIEEIQTTMKNYKMNIDMRHMMLLADLMTYRGEVLGITRFGIQMMKESVLMLASFEKTADHLFNASFNGRHDDIEGVGECIIMGIPIKIGTGVLKVRQSVQHVPNLTYAMDPILS
ncbi:hypothetical protein IFM89_002414 [Coptis chinensis]|uniref:DNA-directed RNA polymerase n=1 Tax=Coptis chinensis TaxID=261450 RepID=A0A835IK88_9MAGN|nr:hypothetical protein IFM89_002414 [Coptis chinensis]